VIGNMAGVMSFRTTQRGSRGRGRIYMGPIGEGNNENNFLSTTVQAGMVTQWSNFHTAMRAHTPVIDPVVASYVHADAHSITSIRADAKIGTQRRRLQRA